MIRVVVTGSECTGKTTLAEALARHYGTPWVPEYARQFVLEKGAAPVYRDVEAIARGQIASEESLAAQASELLIQDTDLLSTVVYSRHYYDDCPAWIEEALRDRGADLYLLAGDDLPWIPDGDQRDRGHMREEMQALFRQSLRSRDARTVELRGSHEERMAAATRLIDQLLQSHR
jgi:NadR type nicotinamide-nucleotide adenylyltransferase